MPYSSGNQSVYLMNDEICSCLPELRVTIFHTCEFSFADISLKIKSPSFFPQSMTISKDNFEHVFLFVIVQILLELYLDWKIKNSLEKDRWANFPSFSIKTNWRNIWLIYNQTKQFLWVKYSNLCAWNYCSATNLRILAVTLLLIPIQVIHLLFRFFKEFYRLDKSRFSPILH